MHGKHKMKIWLQLFTYNEDFETDKRKANLQSFNNRL